MATRRTSSLFGPASTVSVDTTGFVGKLQPTDDTSQKCFDRLDGLAFDGSEISIDASGFSGNLTPDDDDVQKVSEAFDSYTGGILAMQDDAYVTEDKFTTVNFVGLTARYSGVYLTLAGAGSADIGNVAELDFERTDAFTICGWVDTAVAGWVFSKTVGGIGYIAFLNSSLKLQLQLRNGAEQLNVVSSDALSGTRHVAVTYPGDSASGIMYVDGAAVSSIVTGSISATTLNAGSARIGSVFTGTLDDVAVYDRVLTPAEIAEAKANRGQLQTLASFADCVGYWPVRDTDGATVADESPSSNDATLAGDAVVTKVRPYDVAGILTVELAPQGETLFSNDDLLDSGEIILRAGSEEATVEVDDGIGGTATITAVEGSGSATFGDDAGHSISVASGEDGYSITFVDGAGTGGYSFTEADGLIGSRDGATWEPIVLASDLDSISVEKWTAIPTADWVYNDPDFTLSVEARDRIDVGYALRFLDTTGIVLDFTMEVQSVTGFSGLTGLETAIAQDSGRVVFELVDEGAGDFRVDIYNYYDSDGFGGYVYSGLIGHTASFAAIGVKAVIADNSSGLGGTITIDELQAGLILVEFYRWGVVATISVDTLTFRGQALTANVTYMWWGDSNRVTQISGFIPGAIGTEAEAFVTANSQHLHYEMGPGRGVYQSFRPFTVNANGAKLQFVVEQVEGFSGGGWQPIVGFTDAASEARHVSDQDASVATGNNRLLAGDQIDVESEEIVAADGDVENVACSLTVVLE